MIRNWNEFGRPYHGDGIVPLHTVWQNISDSEGSLGTKLRQYATLLTSAAPNADELTAAREAREQVPQWVQDQDIRVNSPFAAIAELATTTFGASESTSRGVLHTGAVIDSAVQAIGGMREAQGYSRTLTAAQRVTYQPWGGFVSTSGSIIAPVDATEGPVIGVTASPYIVAPTRASVSALKEFGLSAPERWDFFEGHQVLFEDPATSYKTATILRLEKETLHAGIWDVVTDGNGALYGFANRSRALGNALGVRNLKLFGADLQNEGLSGLLTRRGFVPGEPVLIDRFGFNKYVPTMHRNEVIKNGR